MREAPITGLSPPPDRSVPTYPVQTKDGNDHNDELDDGCHWRRREIYNAVQAIDPPKTIADAA